MHHQFTMPWKIVTTTTTTSLIRSSASSAWAAAAAAPGLFAGKSSSAVLAAGFGGPMRHRHQPSIILNTPSTAVNPYFQQIRGIQTSVQSAGGRVFFNKAGRIKTDELSKDDDDENNELEDSDDEDGDDGGVGKFQEKEVMIMNRKLDSIACRIFRLSRTDAQAEIASGKILLNSMKVTSKTKEVSNDDEIDFVRRRSEENRKMLIVSRAVVLSSEGKSQNAERKDFALKFRYWHELIVPAEELGQ